LQLLFRLPSVACLHRLKAAAEKLTQTIFNPWPALTEQTELALYPEFQRVRALPVLLLSLTAALPGFAAATPKPHTVTLGATRRVSYTQPDATPEAQLDLTSTIKVRPLIIDGRQREWTTGNIHEITDRTFAVRRALRVNDALATDSSARWIWQPGPWIAVDRATGHITALHLPDFDPLVSDAVWFRDYAAYCGTATTSKGASLYVVVAQLGSRRPIVQKRIGPWPQPNHSTPVCAPAQWDRLPLRVTLQPTGAEATTYDVVGTSSIIEDGDNDDSN
jgi:hypothetical protein